MPFGTVIAIFIVLACGPCSMVLQTKINAVYVKVQRTYVSLQTLQLLASLTPALTATEQRYSTTQVIHPS